MLSSPVLLRTPAADHQLRSNRRESVDVFTVFSISRNSVILCLAVKPESAFSSSPSSAETKRPLLCLQTYAIHVRDVIRKAERDYKLTTQNNTVEYLLKGLEPGGRYSISVRLRNMSKEASFTLSTGATASM